MTVRYMQGFGNEFGTEALEGALPDGQNSPQRCPYGLYAEHFSGTAFTAPRAANRRSWLYRIRPSVVHPPFRRFSNGSMTNDFTGQEATPNQLRWSPVPIPAEPKDFIDGWITLAGNGSPDGMNGCAIHVYAANRSMSERYFCDADAELLIVPQEGGLRAVTEMGILEVRPLEILLIPRGVRFRIELLQPQARGYVCENFAAGMRLPDLGPIGSNGLANPLDFQFPCAAFEDIDKPVQLVQKFLGNLWITDLTHSPCDVVAWRGNLAPCKYDLRRFNTMGSISFDHPDPSIFLVLQAVSDTPGVDWLDFVIFPPRVLVQRDTFRPPWFHRNVASEFMGLIQGSYDAKTDGFLPGGASLHNMMSAHGPDAAIFERAERIDTTVPEYLTDTMAFMFETRLPMRPTPAALLSPQFQPDYYRCWEGLGKRFNGKR